MSPSMNATKRFFNYYWYLLLINIQKLPGGKTPLNIICSWKTLKNLPSTIFIFCLICKVALPGISYSNICSEISDTVFIQILKSLERHIIWDLEVSQSFHTENGVNWTKIMRHQRLMKKVYFVLWKYLTIFNVISWSLILI